MNRVLPPPRFLEFWDLSMSDFFTSSFLAWTLSAFNINTIRGLLSRLSLILVGYLPYYLVWITNTEVDKAPEVDKAHKLTIFGTRRVQHGICLMLLGSLHGRLETGLCLIQGFWDPQNSGASAEDEAGEYYDLEEHKRLLKRKAREREEECRDPKKRKTDDDWGIPLDFLSSVRKGIL